MSGHCAGRAPVGAQDDRRRVRRRPVVRGGRVADRCGGVTAAKAWGLFQAGELVSCAAVVTVDDTIAIWSMATPHDRQRHGYGRRLLSAIHAAGRDAGATTSVLYASPEGEPLYRSIGYAVAEYWQVWSRARWVFPPV